jgi:hypothetical protein
MFRQRLVFLMWGIDANTNKSIIIYMCVYIYIYTHMFPKVGLLEETVEGGKTEENDRE